MWWLNILSPGKSNGHCGHLPGAEPGSGLSLLAMGLCRDTGPCLGATSDCKHNFVNRPGVAVAVLRTFVHLCH